MSDLRSACIEAMAEAAWGRNHPMNKDMPHSGWAANQRERTGSYLAARHDAIASLDALLGVLEEHADEVADISIPTDVRGLLAVLREDT